MNTRTPAVVVLLLVLGGGLWYGLRSGEGGEANDPVAAQGPVSGGVPLAASKSQWSAEQSQAAGLQLDAARMFELGYAGGLVIDANTRSALEAVMASMPDEPTDADLAKLEKTLRESMPSAEADRAMKLVRGYRDYTREVKTQMAPMGIPQSMDEANAFFDRMAATRAKYFDASTNKAMFGDHDEHARITMQAMFVAQDASLSFAEKKARLDALRAKLPADQRSLIAEPTEPTDSAPASAPQ
jgi:lipase chaperone LimK